MRSIDSATLFCFPSKEVFAFEFFSEEYGGKF